MGFVFVLSVFVFVLSSGVRMFTVFHSKQFLPVIFVRKIFPKFVLSRCPSLYIHIRLLRSLHSVHSCLAPIIHCPHLPLLVALDAAELICQDRALPEFILDLGQPSNPFELSGRINVKSDRPATEQALGISDVKGRHSC